MVDSLSGISLPQRIIVSAVEIIPTTQLALQWIRVSDKDPFQWTTSAPVIQPSELGIDQVLIENHAVSLNPIDHKMAATNFANTKLPAVTGYDVSGRIIAIGNNVQDFQLGDEVFGVLNLNSSHGGGALQQYSVAEIDTLMKKPSNIDHTQAATLGIAFLSAMDGLRQAKIDSSTSVFIPGGVGHFSVQIAQIRGAKQIITSASKEEGIRILKEKYHIKHVINHATNNIIERVMELTNGQGVDVVYDSTYLPSSFDETIQVVKEGGLWIVLRRFGLDSTKDKQRVAQRNGKLIIADLGQYWLGNERTQLKSFAQNSPKQGATWIEEGKLKPYINRIIKLEDAQNALELIKQGQSGFGKIVVKLL